MGRRGRWVALGAGLAAAVAALALPRPRLVAVGPYPGATVAVMRPPAAALFDRTPTGVLVFAVDGRPVAARAAVRRLVTASLPAVPAGSHTLGIWLAGRGGFFTAAFPFRRAVRAVPALPAETREAREERQAVNRVREAADAPPLGYDPSLAAAAEAHARYFAQNVGDRAQVTVAAHEEQPGRPGFTGPGPLARDTAFGFYGEGVSEVMAFDVTDPEAVALWVGSVYHRLGLLDPGLQGMGFGRAGSTAASPLLPVVVVDAGYLVPRALPVTRATLWPRPGAIGVPLEFTAGEVPDPADSLPGATYPLGYPVTISFFSPKARTLTGVTGRLEENGRPVPAFVLSPDNDVHRDELGATVAILKRAPLLANADYRADVRGVVVDVGGGRHPFHVAFGFSTRARPAPSALGSPHSVTVAGVRLRVRGSGDAAYVAVRDLADLGVRLDPRGLTGLRLERAGHTVLAWEGDELYRLDGRWRRWRRPPAGARDALLLPYADVARALDLPRLPRA
jgi:uncharacterized protein YkwD